MRLLTRCCLAEALRLFGFYALSFLALVSVAVVAPLVRTGAPLLDVLRFLPAQLALPAGLALPLALVTAVMATLGRMRDDGELVALQAAGISRLRPVVALLPLVVVVGLALTLLTHQVLPESFRAWREGKATLLRQAVATKVAKREFLYQGDGTAIAADGVEGNTLTTVFARHELADGGRLMLFAPDARWVAASGDEGLALSLELRDARMVYAGGEPAADDGIELAAGAFPRFVAELGHERPLLSDKPDTRSTPQLVEAIGHFAAALDAVDRQPDDQLPEAVAEILTREPLPPSRSPLYRWRELHAELRSDAAGDHRHPLAAHLPPDLRQALDAAAVGDPALRSRFHQALDAVWRQLAADPSVFAELPPALRTVAPGPAAGPAAARFVLDAWLPHHLAPAPLTALLRDIASPMTTWGAREPGVRAGVRRGLVEDLRRHQLTWHLRWLLPLLAPVGWLLASGLALTLSSRSRLLAVGIGLGTVLLAVLPGVGAVRGLGPLLGFHPGPLLWAPATLMTVVGSWLLWRQR